MRVGVTGHQDLGPPHVRAWIETTMGRAIDAAAVSLGMTCLAKGADQLYARLLNARHIPFLVVIPSANYEDSFGDAADLANFRELLASAAQVVVRPFPMPSERAYSDAGKYVVDNCTKIIAAWNGQPARGLGGTGDIVAYARTRGRVVVHINPIARTVSEE